MAEHEVDAVSVVQKVTNAFNSHDVDAICELVTSDYHEYTNGALVADSREAMRTKDEPLYASMPDLRRTTEELWGTRDRAVGRYVLRATRPDGAMELEIVVLYRTRGGKVAECRIFFDPALAFGR